MVTMFTSPVGATRSSVCPILKFVIILLVYHVRYLHPNLVQDCHRLAMSAMQNLFDVVPVTREKLGNVDGIEFHGLEVSAPLFNRPVAHAARCLAVAWWSVDWCGAA